MGTKLVSLVKRLVPETAVALLALAIYALPAPAVEETLAPPPLPALNEQLVTPLESAVAGSRTGLVVLIALAVLLAAAMLYWAAHIRRRGVHRTTTNYPGFSPADETNLEKNTGPITTPVP